MTEPRAFRVDAGPVELQAYEWPGEGRPVLFVHATGFHARCWDQVVARLPGRHAFAIDMRGHGLSDKPAPPYGWRPFGEDAAAVMRELGLEGAVGVGHSMGGHSLALAAALEPDAFAGLILLDPVILPRERYTRSPVPAEHFAARRRNHWSSPHEMEERYRGRAPFAAWDSAVLHDYCEYGLVRNPEGHGYVLACPPAIEAAIYAASGSDGDIYEEIASVEAPVRVLRARTLEERAPMDMSASPTAPDLANHFRQGEDVPLPQYSHFIPMEGPAFVAGEVEAMLGRLDGEEKRPRGR